jgi:S-methylmethionine-dependent homocysteine/selenocysteine methylase
MPTATELPSLAGERLYISDGGMETTLIFHAGLDLPHFAAFDLLRDRSATDVLRAYYRPYVEVARELGVGAVLDAPTWRASSDWGTLLGYSREELDAANRQAVAIGAELRDAEAARGGVPIVVNGAIGPRGDGYDPGAQMSSAEAEAYHATQIATFAGTEADMVTALTMNQVAEAVGIVRAAAGAGLPVVVSFTVETDGCLPTGQALGEAIEQVDAETGAAAQYFMINCAHPTHFAGVLEDGGAWLERVGGLRANASRKSHAELDESETLDEGDPEKLGSDHLALRERLRKVTVVGGCCGTDHRHVAAVCRAWQA